MNCTAVDAAGNQAQGSFKVTVTDATAPTLNLPDDIAVETDNPDGVAVEFTATATDAVDGAVPVTCVPALSGSVFPVGETTVNCSACQFGRQADPGQLQGDGRVDDRSNRGRPQWRLLAVADIAGLTTEQRTDGLLCLIWIVTRVGSDSGRSDLAPERGTGRMLCKFPARTAAFQGLCYPSRRRTQRKRILILITSLILNAEANGAR